MRSARPEKSATTVGGCAAVTISLALCGVSVERVCQRPSANTQVVTQSRSKRRSASRAVAASSRSAESTVPSGRAMTPPL